MSSTFSHDDIRQLLGAYAVDAVSVDEHLIIAAHIEHCELCRSEIDMLHDAAAQLGAGSPITMPDLWLRIRNEIDDPGVPPLRIPNTTDARSSGTVRSMRAILAIAASVAVIVGSYAVGNTTAEPKTVTRFASDSQQAQQAGITQGARVVSLRSSTNGGVTAKVVLLPDGKGYVYDTNLPALPADHTYQLWAIVNNAPVSAGVLGSSISAIPFAASGPITAFAITDEVAGGVVNSSRNPVVLGQVTT